MGGVSASTPEGMALAVVRLWLEAGFDQPTAALRGRITWRDAGGEHEHVAQSLDGICEAFRQELLAFVAAASGIS